MLKSHNDDHVKCLIMMLEIFLSKGEVSDDAKSVLTIYIGSSSDAWILDSNCKFYICSNKSWFDTCKVINGTILLGYNNRLSVIGVSTILIRMYNYIVRIL